jgi:ATP-dependent helicase/nuclease subunit A
MSVRRQEFTPDQLMAVETRGSALLVSAGAGSGKTRVLVERLLRHISGGADDCDITEFLVITYTRAAASELRSRILDEISERLASQPDNRHLRRQAALVYEAKIGTIHSFCTDILRENAHKAGLSPDFRVADESEAGILKDKVLEELLDSRYETMEEASGFQLLVDTMSAGRDDKKLKEIVLETHSKLQSHAAPEKWIAAQMKTLDAVALDDVSETVWGRFLMDDAQKKVSFWLGVMERMQEEMRLCPDFERAYGDSIAATVDSLARFEKALEGCWDEARLLACVDFPKAKNVTGHEDFKERRKKCKKALEKLSELFECDSAALLEDMGAVKPAVAELLTLVTEFDRAYANAKKKRSLVDFSDLEHLSARILTDAETGRPSDTARAVSRRFREILVDEYQDVSRVQELIFGAVSRDGSNLFMVGDVRQSIYRFRLADPTIFLEKYKSYGDIETETDGTAAIQTRNGRVLLSANFRSRAGILEAVNHVFAAVMSEDFGEMAYTQREYLSAGRLEDVSAEPPVELDVLDMLGLETEEDEEDPEKIAVEADFVADRIDELLQSGMTVPDEKGGRRRLCCGDFAILLRSVKDKAAVFERALSDRGLAASLPGGEGFFEVSEVAVALSLLSIIDNPRQDIPLIAVLRSPVFGFTPDELAQIRAADKSEDFYGALEASAGTSSKSRAFLDELSAFRLIAPDMASDKFLWHVYHQTNMLAVMGALRGGSGRRLNLMRLLELAARCETNGYKGLFGFMTYVRKLAENGEEPFRDNDPAFSDAVRIMSIHKSKGLEFPVVILADTTKRFNRKDTAAPLLIHPELGVGAKRADLERRIEYPTLARLAVAKKLTLEMLSEELRVLYVAMTRAREKLIIVSTFADADKKLSKLCKDAGTPVAPQILENAAGMSSFILLPVLTRPEAACLRPPQAEPTEDSGEPSPDDGCPRWDIRKIVIRKSPAKKRKNTPAAPERAAAVTEDLERLGRNLGYVYPYRGLSQVPSKLTATGLKGRFADYEAAEEAGRINAAVQRSPASRPDFVTQRSALTPAERGTALHLAMQFIDYRRCLTLDGIRGELRRLGEKAFLSAAQASAVEPEKILAFFTSELGRRVLRADRLYREFKFSLLVPAVEYYPEVGTDSMDEVLLQGVVDCCFVEDGALHVIDFKTDYVTRETLAEKTKLYTPQLMAYGRAMERIVGLPVASRLIYFFALGAESEIW